MVVALENRSIGRLAGDDEGSGPEDLRRLPIFRWSLEGNRSSSVRQKRRVDRKGLGQADLDLPFRGRRDAGNIRSPSFEVVGEAGDRRKRRGRRITGIPDRSFERSLDGAGGQRGAVGEHDFRTKAQAHRLPAMLQRPPLAERGDEIPL